MYRISKEETGKRIRKLMMESGITVREIQEEMELESPQAVYKWLNGRAVPSTENMVILSQLLHVSIESMIVLEKSAAQDERKKAWDEKHPKVFIDYMAWKDEAVRTLDKIRLGHFFEELVMDRARTALCSE